MTASLASRLRQSLLALPLLVPAFAGGASASDQSSNDAVQVAQDSGPRRLVPRVVAPSSPGKDRDKPKDAPGVEISPPPVATGRIETNPLQRPHPDGAGTLDAENGGFAGDLWQGVPRGLVEQLMGRLPATITSPVMRDMLRRLLLTAATPPEAAADENRVSLLSMRVKQLQKMGLLGSSAELINAADNRESDAELLRLKAENHLLRNDLGGACAEADRQSFRVEVLFWQQLLIYCQAVQGDAAGASLGANLLAEAGDLKDPIFFALVHQLTDGAAATVDSLPDPSPLLLSMLRTAKVQIPANAAANANPPLLGMIGASPNAPIELRLDAAERAARYGALTPDRLAEVYASVTFSRDDLDNALSIAESSTSPRGRALLYQAALVHTVPTARAEVLQKAWSLARKNHDYALSVRVFAPLLVKMAPSGEMAWFAIDAARALFALRRPFLARRWMQALRQEAARDANARTALNSLWAMARLADKKQSGESSQSENNVAVASRGIVVGALRDIDDSPESWREAVRQLTPETARRQIADTYVLFSAVGEEVGIAAWRALLADAGSRQTTLPDPAYSAALAAAAEAGRRGEVILVAALMLGQQGAGELDLTAVAEIVQALRGSGLQAEARDLVIEAAVQKGL